jgi:phosphatidylserine decarboxylase
MVRIAPGGYDLAVPAAVVAAVTGALAVVERRGALAAASLAFTALAAAILAFHRDPDRETPPAGVVSPADGTVSVVREEDGRIRVGVYMHPTSVHVNRAPLAGVVTDVEHVSGGNVPAFDKESDRNERVHVDFEEFRVTLIAGAMARRIHPYVEAGDDVGRGDRIGHISFGSRVDTLLPESYDRDDVSVREGDAVRAGETVLARDPDA